MGKTKNKKQTVKNEKLLFLCFCWPIPIPTPILLLLFLGPKSSSSSSFPLFDYLCYQYCWPTRGKLQNRREQWVLKLRKRRDFYSWQVQKWDGFWSNSRSRSLSLRVVSLNLKPGNLKFQVLKAWIFGLKAWIFSLKSCFSSLEAWTQSFRMLNFRAWKLKLESYISLIAGLKAQNLSPEA